MHRSENLTANCPDAIAVEHKLYGRDSEVRYLLDKFEGVNRGRGEVCLLAGLSGTGKTSLANTLRTPVQERNGFFLEGKFNQYDKNVPYLAWRQALANFCGHVCRDTVSKRKQWAEQILAAVGDQGQLLVDLVPEFETLLGRQPDVDAISPQESRHRFTGVIRNALAVICRPENPLVLFIDDWQWADPASLHLLSQLRIDSTLRYMLLVASYRSDEVSEEHGFLLTLDLLRSQRIPVSTIKVEHLSETEIESLVMDGLNYAPERRQACAKAIYSTTGGNVFFAHALIKDLQTKQLVHGPTPSASDTFDFPGSIVEIFDRKIESLEDRTQELLSLAACLGNRFDISTLATVSGYPVCECSAALDAASDLVMEVGNNFGAAVREQQFQFVHDRVQQAAYSRIKAERLPSIRLQIARKMIAQWDPEELNDRAGEVAEQFNAGYQLVESEEERLRGVELNIAAAGKARDATAFHSALDFYRAALNLIRSPDLLQRYWEQHHDLTLTLHHEHAKAEYLEGTQQNAESLVRVAVENVRTPIEKAEVLTTLIVQHTLRANYENAIATGREALSELGMALPDSAYEQARDEEIEQARCLMQGRSLEEIIEMPVASDENVRAAAKVLITMGPPCYRAHQRLWSVIVPRVVNLTLRHGRIPQIGYSHTAFTGLLGWVSSDFELGKTYCEIATRFMTPELASSSDRSVFHLMMGSSARHWFWHMAECTADYEAAIETGRQSGNLQYAAYAFGHNMYCRFFQGVPLEELIAETESSLAFSKTRQNQWAIDLLQGGLRVFNELHDATNRCLANSKEAEYLSDCEAHSNRQVACIYHVLRSQQDLLLGRPRNALESTQRAKQDIEAVGTQGLLPWPEYVFARAMALLCLLRDEAFAGDEDHDHEVVSLLEQLQVWSTQCPQNFGAKYLLASAEWKCLQGEKQAALDLYDQAIEAAHENSFRQWEGYANERVAQFWKQQGDGRLQQVYWQRAYDCYESWGANAKLELMTSEYQKDLQVSICTAVDSTSEDAPSTQDSVRRITERQVAILRGQTSEAARARKQAEADVTADELARAAESLRMDVASGRRTALKLRAQRDAEQAINEELERRVKERTSDLEQAAAELSKTNIALEQMEERFRATVESAPVAMVMIDENGRIVLVNTETEKLFGYSRDELSGKAIEILVPEHFHSSHAKHEQRDQCEPPSHALGTGRELYAKRRDGTEFPVEIGLNPVETSEETFVLGAITDISLRKKSEAALLESESRFRTIADSSPLAMWVCDEHFLCSLLNKRWIEYSGRSQENQLGNGWLEVVHPDDRQLAIEKYQEAFALRDSFTLAYRLRRHDGQYRWHTAIGTPRRGEGGRFLGYVGVSIDDHDERALRDELQQYNASLQESEKRAREASRAKSQFLANMSHEIRTPMNAIIGLTDLVLSSDLSTIQRDYLQSVASSSEALLGIINDILDFSKIEAGKLELEEIEFQVQETIGDAIKSLSHKAHERDLEIALRISPDIPEVMLGDPSRLRQILVNLVGNSLKFTESGHVCVDVRRSPDQPTAGDCEFLQFSVEDTGVGIPEEKLAAIFQPFEQADTSNTRRFGGTGLGLTITSRLVAMMGGRLLADSKVGQGSTFCFTACFGKSNKVLKQPWRKATSKLIGKKAIVVDDSSVNREIAAEILETSGFSVTTANDAHEALRLLREAKARDIVYDIVLTDVQMPGVDGYQLASMIHKIDGYANVPIIALASSLELACPGQAETLGLAAQLTKPVKQSELLEHIVLTLGLTPSIDEAQNVKRSLRSSDQVDCKVAPQQLKILLAEDSLPNQKLAIAMLAREGHDVSVVQNGREAVAAVESEEFDLVLMDIQMPEMDGLEATETIRKREEQTGKHLPIVAMTAHALKGDRERFLGAGMDEYVSKPVRHQPLVEAIEAAMKVNFCEV